jgi:hypothetical protein
MSEEMSELAAYFYEHVFHSYRRYKTVKFDQLMGNNKDRRVAIDAAVALYHFREHIPSSHRKNYVQLASLCPDYTLIRDIANVAKHKQITYYDPQIANIDDIKEILVSTKFVDQDGEYIHEEKVVEVELINSSIRDIDEILTNVVNMWFGELHQIGAIDRVEPIQLRKPGLVSRDKASRVSLEITKGIRMKMNFRFQKYNYESNLLEPVYFSDAENIVFTVSRRPTFKLVLKNSSGKK